MPDRRPPARTYRPRPRRPEGPASVAGEHEIDTGRVDIIAESQTEQQWLVIVNGVPSSYVDLTDATRLEFEYTRWIGDLIDLHTAPGEPLHATHLGGAGCSLARYVAATRPGSRQIVFEYDARLATLMRQAFALRAEPGLRLRVGDARAGIAGLAPASTDVIVRDAFLGNQVPPHLRTVEFLTDVVRVLTPGGFYVSNIADGTHQRQARTEAATALEVFEEVLLIAEPAHFRGRQYGYRNVLLVASRQLLPEPELTRRLASGSVRGRLVPTERVRELAAGYRPHRDAGQAGSDDEEVFEVAPEDVDVDGADSSVSFLR